VAGTLGASLGRLLAAAGVRQLFGDAVLGAAVTGVAHRPVADPALAVLLAAADGRLGPGPGAALLADGTLLLTARPGGSPAVTPFGAAALLPQIVARAADWCDNDAPGEAAFRLELDLDAPAPDLVPAAPPPRPPVELPDRLPDEVLLYAGPGVVRRGFTERLRALSARTNRGVVNSWGAKGLFAWDDPRHLGTVGLQRDDFTMAGFADAAPIVAVGVDDDETPVRRFGLGPVLWVPPEQLDDLDARLSVRSAAIGRPPLFDALSAVCMPSYDRDDIPLHPGRAIIETKGVLGPADRVAADAGGALGLWIARAFPTSFLGSVVVPGTVAPGFAAAAALAAAVRPEPVRVLGCTLDPLDEVTAAVLELGRAWGAAATVVAWSPDAPLTAAVDAGPAVAAALAGGGVQVVRLPVDLTRTEELVAVAGPLVAWS
jgi:hypothetical protein